MSMRAQCRAAAATVLGRDPSDSLLDKLQAGLARSMRALAKQDPETWGQLSQQERIAQAVEATVADLKDQAAKAKQRVELQTRAVDKAGTEFRSLLRDKAPAQRSLIDYLERVDARSSKVAPWYWRNVLDGMQRISPNFWGFFSNRAFLRDFTHEVYSPGSTKSPMAAKFAKDWLKTVEDMRTRYNATGGDVGKLPYGYLPQRWNSKLVRDKYKTADEFAHTMLGRLDRKQYVREDGSPMDDAEATTFLKEAYETITTHGLNKTEPGQFRPQSRIARFSQSRQIHFKDADSYLETSKDLAGALPFDLMRNHINGLGRHIGLTEEMGPNWETTYRYLRDTAVKMDGEVKHMGAALITTQHVWDVVNGHVNEVAHPTFANFMQNWRNLKTSILLGKVLLTQLTDFNGMLRTARFNHMPVFKTYSNFVRSFGKDMKREAAQQAVGIDHIIADVSRYTNDLLPASNWSGRLADFTIRASGTHALMSAMDRGFQATHMMTLGRTTRTKWDNLPEAAQARLIYQGVRKSDWDIWNRATPEKWRGQDALTPEAVAKIPGLTDIERNDAIKALLAFTQRESQTAIHQGSNLTTRAGTTRSTKRGEISREVLQSFLMYKSYALSYMMRHFQRAWMSPTVLGKAGSLLNLAVGMTLMGAVSEQLYSIATGKNAQPMNTAKFWLNAIARGGGLGIVGDILKTGMEGGDRSAQVDWTFLSGPIAGDIGNLASIGTRGVQATGLMGEEAQAKAQRYLPGLLYKEAKGNIPLPGLNLWYTQAATNHLLFNTIQEWLNPGYLQRTKQRAAKAGETFWWAPDQRAPSGFPQLTGGAP